MVDQVTKTQLDSNAWATAMLIERSRSVSPDDLDKPQPIGPGPLRETIWHIIDAMFYFADGFAGRAYTDRDEARARASLDALASLLDSADGELRTAIDEYFQSHSLTDPVRFPVADSDIPAHVALAQIFDHGCYHRAQCVHMLKRLGALDEPLELSPLDRESDGG